VWPGVCLWGRPGARGELTDDDAPGGHGPHRAHHGGADELRTRGLIHDSSHRNAVLVLGTSPRSHRGELAQGPVRGGSRPTVEPPGGDPKIAGGERVRFWQSHDYIRLDRACRGEAGRGALAMSQVETPSPWGRQRCTSDPVASSFPKRRGSEPGWGRALEGGPTPPASSRLAQVRVPMTIGASPSPCPSDARRYAFLCPSRDTFVIISGRRRWNSVGRPRRQRIHAPSAMWRGVPRGEGAAAARRGRMRSGFRV